MHDLSPLHAALPFWVSWGVQGGLALLMVLGTWLLTRWAGYLARPRLAADSHWTEQARQHYAGYQLCKAAQLMGATLGALVVYYASGPMSPMRPLYLAALTFVLALLLPLWSFYKGARRVHPWLTPGLFLRSQLVMLVVVYPVLPLSLGLAVLGPAELGWPAVCVYGCGLAVMVWLFLGGSYRLGSVLGLLLPPRPELSAVAAAAARACGREPGVVQEIPLAGANAFAFPFSGQILVSSRAVDCLSREELHAVLLHELGHLGEGRVRAARRLQGLFAFVVLSLWQPLHAYGGIWLILGLLLLSIVFSLRGKSAGRQLEERADAHAHSHSEDAAVYARALESIHRHNLAPMVMPDKSEIHPHTYDRMLAAGLQPDYPRPAPPHNPVRRRFFALGLPAAAFVLFFALRDTSPWQSRQMAWLHLLLANGSDWGYAALGETWIDDRPEAAAAAFGLAWQIGPGYPGYAMDLARLAARRGEVGQAQGWIREAEARLPAFAQRASEGRVTWIREKLVEAKAEVAAAGHPKSP